MQATLQLFGVLEAKWAQNGSKKKITFQKHALDVNFKLTKNRLNGVVKTTAIYCNVHSL
jgi:hypothetical protein